MPLSKNSNPFQPALPEPNPQPYIRRPVEEPSAVGALGSFVKDILPGAVNAYANYRVSEDVMKGVDEVLGQYEDFYQNRPDQSATGISGKLDNMWANLGDADKPASEGDWAKVDLMDKALISSVDRWRKAVEQGITTEAGAMAKITQLTREAVARNPWLEEHYYTSIQNYLKRSGIGDLLDDRQKAVEDAEKAERDKRDYWEKKVVEKKLPFRQGMPVEEMIGMVNKHNAREQVVEYLEQDIKRGKLLGEQEITERFERGEHVAVHGIQLETDISRFATMFEGLGVNELSAAKLNMTTWKQDRMNEWRTRLSSGLHLPQVDKWLTHVEKQYDDVIKIVENAKDGTEIASVLKKRAEILLATEQIAVHGQINTVALDKFRQLAPFYPPGVLAAMPSLFGTGAKDNNGKPTEVGTITKLTYDFSRLVNTPVNNSTTGIVESVKIPGSVANTFEAIITPKNIAFTNADKKENMGILALNTNIAIQSGQLSKDEALDAANGLISVAAKNTDAILAIGKSPAYARQLDRLISFSVKNQALSLMSDIDKLLETAKPGEDVDLEMTRDGYLHLEVTGAPNGLQISEAFYKRYLAHINNALDAYASAYGKSRAEVKDEFYMRYFGMLFDTEQIEGASKQDSEVSVETTMPTKNVETTALKDTKQIETKRILAEESKKLPQLEEKRKELMQEEKKVEELNKDPEYLAAKRKALEKRLRADRVAYEIALKERPNDTQHLKWLLERITDAETALYGKPQSKGLKINTGPVIKEKDIPKITPSDSPRKGPVAPEKGSIDDEIMKTLAAISDRLSQPRTVVRDANGRITGLA